MLTHDAVGELQVYVHILEGNGATLVRISGFPKWVNFSSLEIEGAPVE